MLQQSAPRVARAGENDTVISFCQEQQIQEFLDAQKFRTITIDIASGQKEHGDAWGIDYRDHLDQAANEARSGKQFADTVSMVSVASSKVSQTSSGERAARVGVSVARDSSVRVLPLQEGKSCEGGMMAVLFPGVDDESLVLFSALGGFPNAGTAIRGYTDTGMTLCMEYSFISY